jgi:PAS domain S-box-containing protein
MKRNPQSLRKTDRLAEENLRLRIQLQEAEETLRAIREGEVDAIIVSGSRGDQVFSLTGAESVYRLIVETMKEAALTITFDGKVLYCNRQFSELIHTPLGGILGHQLNEFVLPEENSSFDLLMARSAFEPVRQRLVFRNSEGECIPAHISTNILHQPDGVSICIVATDLTELESSTEMLRQLRIQREALAESEQRYRELVEFSPGAIVVYSEGKCAYVNPAGQELFLARSLNELLGREARSFLHPYYLDTFSENVRRALETDVAFTAEMQFLRLDGSVMDVEVRGTGIIYQGGPAVLLFLQDITKQKASRLERERLLADLENQKSFLLGILDQMPAGIIVVDVLQNKVLMYNDQMARLLTKQANEKPRIEEYFRIAAYRANGVPYEFLDRPLARAAISGEIVVEEEMHFSSAGGKSQVCLVSAAPIRDKDGKIIAAVSINIDIGERKRMEEELQIAREGLETRVQERTAELLQTVDRLNSEISRRIAAENELRERTKQLSALAAQLTIAEEQERRRITGILHDDLQQLLVGAKLCLSALNRTPDKVKQASSELDKILSQSIEVTRSLTAELSPPVLRKGGFVPALQWLARWTKQRHGLEIDLKVDERLNVANEEMRILLFQSVRELLFNVIKHARVQQASVTVSVMNDQLRIVVSDQGIGFDPAAIGPQSGGFGLFSVQERLLSLGGRIEIDSKPGRGSRFSLVVPLSGAAVEAEGVSAPEARRIRILVVDDHVIMRQGLAHLLKAQPDMEVVGEASNGESAIKMARQFLPDVIVMDVSMPVMSGADATRVIHSEMPDVQVIGLSMFDEEEKAETMRKAGAVRYLTKTGPSNTLIAAIRESACSVRQRSIAQ